MNAYVIINLSKERYYSTAQKVVERLFARKDLKLIFPKENEDLFGANGLTIDDAEMIISIGGDGTLLQSGKLALERDLPLVGINAGRAGALCKYSIDEIIDNDDAFLKDPEVSPRDVLEMEYAGKRNLAINDFLFSSRNAGQTIVAGFTTDGADISYHASGVIVSTATGSTAYNASASRCVLDPRLEANIITPICPCGEEKNSLVLGNGLDITVSNRRMDDPIDIYCDGAYIGELKDDAIIRKHPRKLKLII